MIYTAETRIYFRGPKQAFQLKVEGKAQTHRTVSHARGSVSPSLESFWKIKSSKSLLFTCPNSLFPTFPIPSSFIITELSILSINDAPHNQIILIFDFSVLLTSVNIFCLHRSGFTATSYSFSRSSHKFILFCFMNFFQALLTQPWLQSLPHYLYSSKTQVTKLWHYLQSLSNIPTILRFTTVSRCHLSQYSNKGDICKFSSLCYIFYAPYFLLFLHIHTFPAHTALIFEIP